MKYLHTFTLIKWNAKRVSGLWDDSCMWISNDNDLKHMASKFYADLYQADVDIKPYALQHRFFPSLTVDMIDHLWRPFLFEEVHSALFDMSPRKALGPNGLHAIFFHKS